MSKSLSSILSGALFFLTVSFATGGSAHAYLDGGAASFIFQILGASLFASLFGIKMFWQRVVKGFTSVIHKIGAIRNFGE